MTQEEILKYLSIKYDVDKEDVIWLIKKVSEVTKDYLSQGLEVRWKYLGAFKLYKSLRKHKSIGVK